MGANPMMAALMARMGGGGAPPGPPGEGGPGGPPDPGAIGRQVASQISSIRSADPELITRQLAQMKEIAVSLIPQTAMRIPKVANHLTGVMKALDGAIQEAQKSIAAAAAAGAVGGGPTPFGSPSIGFSAAQPGSSNGPGGM